MKLLSDRAVDRLAEEVSRPDLAGTRYEMIRAIAAGGMGKVYLARDKQLDRQVALKVTNYPDLAEELTRRVIREARIIATLEHPGIVPVHDIGRLADGRVFFAMKYVQGWRLDQYIDQTMPVSERLRCLLRIAETVAFAHSRGVVHRDLKPGNIIVGEFGEVIVMDWGIAKMLGTRASPTPSPKSSESMGSVQLSLGSVDPDQDESNSSATAAGENGPNGVEALTSGGAILGTPGFMPPEQAEGRNDEVGPRSDIYSLGALLYWMVTGLTPEFHAGHLGWPPGSKRPPGPLRGICGKCLDKNPAGRYADASALADDLGRFLDGQAVGAYREGILELSARALRKNRFLVILIVAYILMRVIVLFLSRR